MKKVNLRERNWETNHELSTIKKRGETFESEYSEYVLKIIKDIEKNGDEALFKYAEKFDNVRLNRETVKVSEEEIEKSVESVDKEVISAIKTAVERIRQFHEKQKENSYFITEHGILLGQRVSPLESVGLYVPGGKAAYPSSVIMNAVPAKVAGVEKLVMITPTVNKVEINPHILVAAKLSGVDEIYRIGGAHGVAALAFGTESIPKVEKIVGPGNIFVAMAKKLLFGLVDIDMIAGPSEILVIADETANPSWIAADLLSQAEHDELAGAFLVTHKEDLADLVIEEVKRQIEQLERKDIAKKSIERFGTAFITRDIIHSCEVANLIAPEHLEIVVKEPFPLIHLVKNAGAIFLGEYACESLGDYILGPNHVLPTGGSAKFFSPLGVYDFIKRTSIIYVNREGFESVKEPAKKLAQTEGLKAHYASVKIRERA